MAADWRKIDAACITDLKRLPTFIELDKSIATTIRLFLLSKMVLIHMIYMTNIFSAESKS